MLLLRSLAATGTIAGIWLVGVPMLLLASEITLFPLALGPARWLGVAPLSIGIGVFVAVTWILGVTGHGTTLAFDPPRRFVCHGPFRWVRNPMYVADVLILNGAAILLESSTLLAYAWLLGLCLHWVVVRHEEPDLRRRFGRAYEAYCQRINRWLPKKPSSD